MCSRKSCKLTPNIKLLFGNEWLTTVTEQTLLSGEKGDTHAVFSSRSVNRCWTKFTGKTSWKIWPNVSMSPVKMNLRHSRTQSYSFLRAESWSREWIFPHRNTQSRLFVWETILIQQHNNENEKTTAIVTTYSFRSKVHLSLVEWCTNEWRTATTSKDGSESRVGEMWNWLFKKALKKIKAWLWDFKVRGWSNFLSILKNARKLMIMIDNPYLRMSLFFSLKLWLKDCVVFVWFCSD